MMGCSHSGRNTVSAGGDRKERKGYFPGGVKLKRLPALSEEDFTKGTLLGRGGFGEVSMQRYKYRLDRTVPHVWFAVKEMRKKKILGTKKGVDMLWGELNAMKRLNHAFVVRMHFAFTSESSCFLGLDLLMGGDLRYYLMKGATFTEEEVSLIAACMASALEHIHSRGVIHRDIKPENIILDEGGFPHLTDFGVAHVEQTGVTGSQMACCLSSGTKQYLAPEVFTKRHMHGRETDIWSLGVTLYELLFRKRPFSKSCPSGMVKFLETAYDLTGSYRQASLVMMSSSQRTHALARSSHVEGTTTSEHDSGSTPSDEMTGSPTASVKRLPELSVVGRSSDKKRSPLRAVVAAGTGGGSWASQGKDHMTYDRRMALHERLPHDLRVPIPASSASIGFLRADTINFLERLLDVRPRLRIGAHRSEDILRHHFISKSFPQMDKVLKRRVSHAFRPGVDVDYPSEDELGCRPCETRRLPNIGAGSMRPTGSFCTDPEMRDALLPVCEEECKDKSEHNTLNERKPSPRGVESLTLQDANPSPAVFKNFSHQSSTFVRAALN